jgi:hypothetical protein
MTAAYREWSIRAADASSTRAPKVRTTAMVGAGADDSSAIDVVAMLRRAYDL